MKKIAFLLLVVGFLLASYATALDVDNVDWRLFAIAAVGAIAGVLLAKRAESSMARSKSVLESNRAELRESIGNIVKDLSEMADGKPLKGDALRDWIDAKLAPDLRRFVEARESMVHLYGLQTYADIMSDFAAGERYVNRVWTSSADSYNHEAEKYLGRAAERFGHAQSQLAEAASR